MRTTIDIEDDVLAAAKEIARRQHVSAGHLVSRLLREAMSGMNGQVSSSSQGVQSVAGFQPFPALGILITDAQIDALRDSEGL
jgi:hypothetical protein